MDSFEEAYQGAPPWEIGRPQPEVMRLAETGAFRGAVLDVGCGTGENTIYLAAHGIDVLGVDAAPTAIRKAREKTVSRNIQVRFKILDARELKRLERKFDTILDSGLFHVFSDEDRADYIRSLAEALQPGGTLYMICFSEREPPGWGPRRITRNEIRDCFSREWKVNFIREATFDTHVLDRPVYAWIASISLRSSDPSAP